jgi:uncharacterized protein (UPF0216 family)
MANEQNNSVIPPQPNFDKAELDLLRDALKRSDVERFRFMMLLIKNSLMLQKAKVAHYTKPLLDK